MDEDKSKLYLEDTCVCSLLIKNPNIQRLGETSGNLQGQKSAGCKWALS